MNVKNEYKRMYPLPNPTEFFLKMENLNLDNTFPGV